MNADAHRANPLRQLPLRLGFGFMNASWAGSPLEAGPAAREAFLGVLHHAMDRGVRFFDTADIYAPRWDAMGHNEALLGEALRSWGGPPEARAGLLWATKGGITRGPGERWGRDASPAYLVAAAERSARALGVDRLCVWQLHRLDPSRSLAEALQGLRAVQRSGIARHLGLSNVNAAQLRAALDAVGGPGDGGLVSVQNQLSPAYRQDLDVLAVCEAHGLAFLPWSPMRGARPADAGLPVHAALRALAEARGLSPFAIAQAWLRSLSPCVLPLPGVTRRASVDDQIDALSVELGPQDRAAVPAWPPSLPVDAELLGDQPRPD